MPMRSTRSSIGTLHSSRSKGESMKTLLATGFCLLLGVSLSLLMVACGGAGGAIPGAIPSATPQLITEYQLSGIPGPTDITTGPDGNLWFADNYVSGIGKITPSGAVKIFALPPIEGPFRLTAGTDGNLWFTEGSLP